MPHEPYTSLMHRTEPFYDDGDLKIYDFTSECGTYVYRDLKEKKYTPIDESRVKKCKTRILRFLATEFTGRSEYINCFKACKQPAKRFVVAVASLLLVERKIELLQVYEKTYMELVDKKRPIGHTVSHEPISVLNYELIKMLKDNEESIQNEYRLYRETYGR